MSHTRRKRGDMLERDKGIVLLIEKLHDMRIVSHSLPIRHSVSLVSASHPGVDTARSVSYQFTYRTRRATRVSCQTCVYEANAPKKHGSKTQM